MWPFHRNHGTALLEQFENTIETHKAKAESRAPVIKARLEALEAEEKDLRTLLSRLEKA